jgi:nitrate/TMAO reductase-like tetraheme cytochrome c subunit
MKKTSILVFVVILASFVAAWAQDNKPLTFQDFIEAKEALEENCIDCHSLEWPLKKIADRAGWEETLTKMANTGAVMGKKTRQQVLEYLIAKSTFQQKCSVCHSLDRPLEKNKEFQAWVATVRRMAAKKPEHLTEEEIRAVSGFLTAKGEEKVLY